MLGERGCALNGFPHFISPLNFWDLSQIAHILLISGAEICLPSSPCPWAIVQTLIHGSPTSPSPLGDYVNCQPPVRAQMMEKSESLLPSRVSLEAVLLDLEPATHMSSHRIAFEMSDLWWESSEGHLGSSFSSWQRWHDSREGSGCSVTNPALIPVDAVSV